MHKYKIIWFYRDYNRFGHKATIILSKTKIDPFIQELNKLSYFEVDLDPWKLILESKIHEDVNKICPGDSNLISDTNIRTISTYICNKTCK